MISVGWSLVVADNTGAVSVCVFRAVSASSTWKAVACGDVSGGLELSVIGLFGQLKRRF